MWELLVVKLKDHILTAQMFIVYGTAQGLLHAGKNKTKYYVKTLSASVTHISDNIIKNNNNWQGKFSLCQGPYSYLSCYM